MADHEIDKHSGVATTGHEWDGIKELNTPLPRWWLWTFYATIVVAVVYWILMPAWPGLTGYTKGVLGYTQRATVAADLAALDASRKASMQRLLAVSSIGEIEQDPQLLQYALAAGSSLFGDNCATCHGAGGQGSPGFPALVDDDWLWGGTLDDIRQTIRFGIRSGHDEARINIMQAFGRDGVLTASEIDDLVEFVVALSGRDANAEAAGRAGPLFEMNCSACHGADGAGQKPLGAPNLTDGIWLYGGDRTALHETMTKGRGGVMPAWTDRLHEEDILALAVYVHSLGGGE
jgi:cytochrome c oxidase cbb3-type subunit 3